MSTKISDNAFNLKDILLTVKSLNAKGNGNNTNTNTSTNTIKNTTTNKITNPTITDIHICPNAKIMARKNGVLIPISEQIISVKQSQLLLDELLDDDISRKTLLHSNKNITYSLTKPNLGRYRVNIYSQRGTYAITIRPLQSDSLSIEDLGLPNNANNAREFTDFNTNTNTNTNTNNTNGNNRNNKNNKKGLFIISGTSGTGRSTTLAAIIRKINSNSSNNNNESFHITTIEDPIEYLYKHDRSIITQQEVGSDIPSKKAGLTMALKQDADIIVLSGIGQIGNGEGHERELAELVLLILDIAEHKIVMTIMNENSVSKVIKKLVSAYIEGRGIYGLGLGAGLGFGIGNEGNELGDGVGTVNGVNTYKSEITEIKKAARQAVASALGGIIIQEKIQEKIYEKEIQTPSPQGKPSQEQEVQEPQSPQSPQNLQETKSQETESQETTKIIFPEYFIVNGNEHNKEWIIRGEYETKPPKTKTCENTCGNCRWYGLEDCYGEQVRVCKHPDEDYFYILEHDYPACDGWEDVYI